MEGRRKEETYHGLGGEELVLREVAEDLLGEVLGALHKVSDTLGSSLLQVSLNGTHVLLEVGTIRLLVERGGLETVAVLEVVDGLSVGGQYGLLAFLQVGLDIRVLRDHNVLLGHQFQPHIHTPPVSSYIFLTFFSSELHALRHKTPPFFGG